MARIRTIKPTFWEDEKIGALSPHARLLFIGSWNLADDEGRLRWTPEYLNVSLFMYDGLSSKRVAALMAEIEAQGLVLAYKAAGRDLGQITRWSKHQRINRPQQSALPAHPTFTDSFTECDRESVTERGTTGGVSDSLGEGNGREGKRNVNPPNPPPSAGGTGGLNPRAAGTNPRANGAKVLAEQAAREKRDSELSGAHTFGANLAGADFALDELEETFERKFGDDPELLEAARDGARSVAGAA